MSLFGPSKQERIDRAIEGLRGSATAKESAEYLRKHFDDAWPRLEAVLISASSPDPVAGAVLRFCLPFLDQPPVRAAAVRAALALIGSGSPAASSVANEALCALGPSLLPDLLAALPAGDAKATASGAAKATSTPGAGVEAAVRRLGERYPQELAGLCRSATGKKDVLAALRALELAGKSMRPALDWVCEQTAGPSGVREAACAAAIGIGPTTDCLAPAQAALDKCPREASELLWALRPAGTQALGLQLVALVDDTAKIVLAVLSEKGAAARPAAPGVARLLSERPSLAEEALATLNRIGPTEDCLEPVAAQLHRYAEPATMVLSQLGERGAKAIAVHRLPGLAQHVDELSDVEIVGELPLVLARKEEASPFIPRIARVLEGHSAHAAAAMRALGELGPLARPASPQILAYFKMHPTDEVAACLAQINDGSFAEVLTGHAVHRAKRLSGGGGKAESSLEALAALGAAARPAAPQILEYFTENASDEALERMARIADPSFFDPLIRYVFNTPRPSVGALSSAMIKFGATTSLSAEIIARAVKASGYDAKGGVTFGTSDQALARLIADPHPAVSNILHLVAEKPDIRIVVEYSCGQASRWGHVSPERQRDKAREELARRGDLPYEPRHYFR